MAAEAGPSPWNSAYEDFRNRFRKVTKQTEHKQGLEWSLSSGWRYKREDDWASKPKKPKTKSIRIPRTGKTVEVPDADYEDFIGQRTDKPSDPDSIVADYIDNAKWTQSIGGVGHIAKIDYAPMRQLMSVQFLDEQTDVPTDEVVFFAVPEPVYAELYYLAESGTGLIDKKGVFRHNLGIRFWDIVRIRGTKHGTRYHGEYITKTSGKGTQFSQQADVDIRTATKTETTEGIDAMDSMATRMFSGTLLTQYNGLKNADKKVEYKAKIDFLRKQNVL
jgi:hypothetical protein